VLNPVITRCVIHWQAGKWFMRWLLTRMHSYLLRQVSFDCTLRPVSCSGAQQLPSHRIIPLCLCLVVQVHLQEGSQHVHQDW
jgi:hypothetical protein